MAFSTITSAQIDAGEPTTQELFVKIKDNEDDHETRITTLEASQNVFEPIKAHISGEGYVGDGILFYRATRDIDILGVRVMTLDDGGDSGSMTIDISKSAAGGGAFSTILTGVITASTTAFTVISGTLIGATTASAGDIMRVDVDSIRAGASGFEISIEYEVA